MAGRTVRALLAVACLFAAPASLRAADYGLFVSITDEDDLLELLTAGEIDEDTYEALLELLHDPVDLNHAGREVLYSLPNLTYADVDAILAYRDEVQAVQALDDLRAARVLAPDKVRALRPFVVVRPPSPPLWDTHGRVRTATAYVAGDEAAPPLLFQARVTTLRDVEAGVAGLVSHNRVSNVQFDETRQALFADPPATRFYLPKYFVQWDTDRVRVVAGTFRIGFGQRLTLDNTGLARPDGARPDDLIALDYDLTTACRESAWDLPSPCAGAAGSAYETPDFRWTDRFRGLAVALKSLPVGRGGWMEVHAFGSYQTHGIYQYELYKHDDDCPDPTDDDNPACAAPPVLRWRGDPLAPTTRFSYQTLPDMVAEWTAGGNVSYFHDSRTHVGVTGYGAGVRWLTRGVSLDFQEWSRTPYGGPFGAVGADASLGVGPWDLAAEVARSFDSQPAGGGFAGLLRATGTFGDHEVEAAVRYDGLDYANPHARPPSEADEFDGLRARDEAGLRLQYSGRIRDLSLRSSLDLWTWATSLDGPLKMRLQARADYRVARWFRPGVYLEYQDRDLRHSGRGACYEVPYETLEGEPVPCSGERVQAGLVLRFLPHRSLTLSAKVQHRFVDDNRTAVDPVTRARTYVFGDRFRQDLIAWFSVAWRPAEFLRLRARLRYLNEDPTDDAYLEESLWGHVEAAVRIRRAVAARLRYEVYAWLDDRDSTRTRSPNPAHWIRADLEFRF